MTRNGRDQVRDEGPECRLSGGEPESAHGVIGVNLRRHHPRQHFLYFFPLPHAHGSFRPWLLGWPNANFLNSAGGCSLDICAVSLASTGFSSQGASIFIENTSSPLPGLNRTPNHASTLAEYFRSSQCACSFLAASPGSIALT
jgi:hypothetical protein